MMSYNEKYRVSFEKGDARRKVFFDFWEFTQKYYNVSEEQDYWDSLCEDGDKFIESFAYDEDAYTLARDLCYAIFGNFETKFYNREDEKKKKAQQEASN